MIMTVQTRLNLTGLDNLQRNFATFTSAYLERLGRVIIEENINKALTVATRGSSTPRMLRASSLATKRGISVPRTTPSGRRARAVQGAAGYNYAGTPIKLNAPATYKRKAQNPASERGGVLLSLVDSGLLLNPNMYRVVHSDSETVLLRVPADRERILGYVRRMGYSYWGVPRDLAGMRPSSYAAMLFNDCMDRWERSGFAEVPVVYFAGM